MSKATVLGKETITWQPSIFPFKFRAHFYASHWVLYIIFCCDYINKQKQWRNWQGSVLDNGEDLGLIRGPCIFFIFLTLICRSYVYTFQAPTMQSQHPATGSLPTQIQRSNQGKTMVHSPNLAAHNQAQEWAQPSWAWHKFSMHPPNYSSNRPNSFLFYFNSFLLFINYFFFSNNTKNHAFLI